MDLYCSADWLKRCCFGAIIFFLSVQQGLCAGEDTAIFWTIRQGDSTAGYLLGTIHSEDPRVVDFSEEFLNLLKSNQVFAMEMVPDFPTLTRLTEYMHYQDGSTLESHIGTAI